MTAAQRRVLVGLCELVTQRGYPPTVRELTRHVGLSSENTVHHHLCNLAKTGFVSKETAKSPRTIRPREDVFAHRGHLYRIVMVLP